MIQDDVKIRRCKNCGRCFVASKSNVLYCKRIINSENISEDDNKTDSKKKERTCSDVGAKHTYLAKKDEIDIIYDRAQKKYRKRVVRKNDSPEKIKRKRKTMTEDEFRKWQNYALTQKNKAKNGEITIPEYEKLINSIL